MSSFFNRYLLPGFVFQGVIIGGGYATGRELVEFFLSNGVIAGLLGMAVAAVIWGAVMAASFELCRMNGSYDYQSFFRALLGRFSFLYEVLYFLLIILILGVILAASGEIGRDLLGLTPIAGILALMIAVAVCAFYGSTVIERFMSLWSIVIYVTFAALVAFALIAFRSDIERNLVQSDLTGPWALDGLRYAGYNIAAAPAVFFCLRHIKLRREAVVAGLLTGPIAMLPAVFLYMALLAGYPDNIAVSIPSTDLLLTLDMPWFWIWYQIVLLGTFIQTGVGLIHSVNERLARTLAATGRTFPSYMRIVVTVGLFLLSMVLAVRFGIIDLIARGYGLLTWGFIMVFVAPVLTLGLLKIVWPGAPVIRNAQLAAKRAEA